MSQYVETPTKTLTAAGALGQYLRVKTPGALALAGAADPMIGTMELPCLAAGLATVRLRSAQGTRKMIGNAAITSGNPVYAAASGKVAPAGTVLEGIALETTTADGDILEVMPASSTDASTATTGTSAAAFAVDNDSATPKIALGAQTGGTGDFTQTIKPAATLTANRTITLPADASDTLVGKATVDTLTNKTLTAPVVNTPTVTVKNTAKTADYTVVAATDSGQTFSNTGAGGTVVMALPAATVGQKYRFFVGAAQALRLDPNGAETISLPSTGVAGGAGKYLGCATVGCTLDIECAIAGSWAVFGFTGTWVAEA